ncbi:MAG TPA: hypothetical protein VGP88_09235 [Thermoplasmata archaeon]|jgi:hypothetical protein|nr:hypothetical protein [Thermoplasmata archaeon]
MAAFRGSDETVDREIATLEAIARMRLRRYAAEMRDLDRDLTELRKERARRRAGVEVPVRAAAETASA